MSPRMRLRAATAVVAACLLPLAACDSGGGASPSPSPTPSYQESPPETTLQRQTRLDFEAAEKSYRTFIAEKNRLGLAGGSLAPTPVMKQTAAGKYLAYYTMLLREQKKAGEKYTAGTKIGYVRRGGYSPQELTLDVCEDGSANRVLDKNGKQISKGQILLRTVYVRPIDGRWKLWNGDERGETSSCASN